jgi:hypothetical protein
VKLTDVRIFDTTIKDKTSNEKHIHPVSIRRHAVVSWTPSPTVPAQTIVFLEGGHRHILNIQFLEFHQWAIGRSLEEIDAERADAAAERIEAAAERTANVSKRELNGTTRRK